ncbi:TPA: protein phosphatase CheZ [Vibrio cholerae]|uniref:Protein phosphatase CheZ n=9 Tax=Gammaproteobacteria TaxID=1236 RepID=CHEZ_VIBC3|nr:MULTISPECIES: protein phosphatase CheZ [Vibrio]A5F6J8.1 RecName: Full=Protein phosphatase CheZ; AltName: Full=Chemotaxis protein CheZ [Vibrio cholerae O395]AEA79005.1 Chemotaxis response - phosphatase CheZ [Vibrio cholerae LMA3984-4]EAZ72511.1 chemotaxis protein CheZ [Vibrio cholerae NCTC 8457]EEY48905.1 chemotaxis response - phosphatase CheZ [Vibrio cholerae INDRE 91/1]EEY51841.1 chemotaxis response - phosphatase CheZ [Vibrio cholerae CT 5369-93]EYC49552.1 protein phosphatase [Vibrio chol
MISLEQAKELVQLLEQGRQDDANRLFTYVYESANNPMFKEIGMLTRDLHEALKNFQIDERFSEIATDEIPDARERLHYVIQKTEVAANKTMDAVDRCMPIADKLHESLLLIRPEWNGLMNGRIELMHFKSLCHRIDDLLSQVEGDSSELRGELTEILMAQDFQDLTGQIIKRVINLVNEVEKRLVEILTVFGAAQKEQKADKATVASIEPEGPILNPHERIDAVSSQDEVDDLLSSLGF